MSDLYPPGVTGQEDTFFDDEANCACGHAFDEHDHGALGRCLVEVEPQELCPCTAYEPEGAY